jgi:hypothetical protein
MTPYPWEEHWSHGVSQRYLTFGVLALFFTAVA